MYTPRAPRARGLEHVLPAANAAVHVHLDLLADSAHDRGQRFNAALRPVVGVHRGC